MGCDNIATHIVYWPGSSPPPRSCKEHAQLAYGIGAAMGMVIHIEEIPYDPSREGESNCQNPKGEVY